MKFCDDTLFFLTSIFESQICMILRSSIFYISVFLLLVSSARVLAVQHDTIPLISFRAVDAISGKPIEMAHIINMTQKKATIADLLGYFKIPVYVGDTVSITSLGYNSLILFNWGQYNGDSTYYTIKLKPRVYQLKELKISWFSTYDKFLKGILDLKLPMTKEEEKIARIVEYFNKTLSKLDLKDLPGSTGGVAFGKDWLAKQNEKLNKQLERERQKRLIERKYSAGIVTVLTGLTGDEVHWFMEYCAFTEEFLLKSSDYEIREKVLDKFKIYAIDKKPKEN